MEKWMEYLKQAADDGASDLFFVAGGHVCEKLDRRMKPISEGKLSPQETEECVCGIYSAAKRDMDNFYATGDDDFSFAIAGMARFRVNAYRQRGSMAAVVRVVAFDI